MSDLLNKASLVVIPSGYKEDTVYSVVPSDGSGDLSFTRASNGTRVNSAGLVEVCPWNLASYSNTFNNGVWSKVGTTLTSGQTDPNGGANAWKVEFAAGSSYLYQPSILVTGVVIMSAYLRADSTTTIGFNDGSAYPNSVTIGTTWQRYEFSFNVTGANTAIQFDNYFGPGLANLAETFYIYGAQLNIGSTAKPYFPTTDRLNVPRLTYQNGGGGCPSLLLEKQSTNLFTYSERFDNIAWLKANINITSNTTISPSGIQDADTMASNGVSTNHLLIQSTSLVSGTSYTCSFFVKKNTNDFFQIFIISTAGGMYANFDINLGIVGTVGNISGATPTSTIENYGNGWYRCVMTFTPTISLTGEIYTTLTTSASSVRAEVNSLSTSVYIWGAQVEASSYPTSYIPTTSASATRVADVAIKSSISSLFGASATSFFMDFEVTQASNGGNWTITGYNGTNLFSLCQFDNSNNYPRIVFEGGVDSTLANALTIGRHKIAVSFATNDFRAYIDGSLVLTDTICTYNRYDRIAVNGTAWTGNTNNNNSFKLNEYAQFPTALTNAELASLTTL